MCQQISEAFIKPNSSLQKDITPMSRVTEWFGLEQRLTFQTLCHGLGRLPLDQPGLERELSVLHH